MLGFWIFMVLRFVRPFVLGLKSRSWPTAKATVVTSSFARGRAAYIPKVTYKASHDGREYQNDTIRFLGAAAVTQESALAVAQRYPERSEVTIHFDPSDPRKAVIVPGVEAKHYVGLAFLTLFCLGVAFIVPVLNLIWPGCQPNCR